MIAAGGTPNAQAQGTSSPMAFHWSLMTPDDNQYFARFEQNSVRLTNMLWCHDYASHMILVVDHSPCNGPIGPGSIRRLHYMHTIRLKISSTVSTVLLRAWQLRQINLITGYDILFAWTRLQNHRFDSSFMLSREHLVHNLSHRCINRKTNMAR